METVPSLSICDHMTSSCMLVLDDCRAGNTIKKQLNGMKAFQTYETKNYIYTKQYVQAKSNSSPLLPIRVMTLH